LKSIVARVFVMPLAAAAAGLLSACATMLPVVPVAGPAVADEPFSVEGRLSARHGDNAVAGSFFWVHAVDRDTITLDTPLGQTLARLSGSAGDARVELADGTVTEASDWEVLTRRSLGVSLPVSGLAWWLRGVPHPRAPATIEADSAGRPAVLRQEGWEIVYAYSDAVARRPSRMRLAWPEVEVRLAIDRWVGPGTP
jgi:outer membrane lipoprotein LolB